MSIARYMPERATARVGGVTVRLENRVSAEQSEDRAPRARAQRLLTVAGDIASREEALALAEAVRAFAERL